MNDQSKASEAPEAERPLEAITVMVSKEFAQLIAGYAMVSGRTQEQYIIESLLSSLQCTAEFPYYKKTPEYKAMQGADEQAE